MPLEAGVTHISKHGFWLLLEERESFLPFENFPWFKDAPVSAILNVQLLNARHLFWPDLDVDLAVESIEHPEHFPLVAKPEHYQRIRLASFAADRAPPAMRASGSNGDRLGTPTYDVPSAHHRTARYRPGRPASLRCRHPVLQFR